MATRRDFLAQFDPQMREPVLSFADRVGVGGDIVISMARKATCFVDALATLKLAKPHVPICSDRVLDMDLSFLNGRTVNLVDDVIISGTTMHEASNTLIGAGADVITDVVAVDEQSWNPELISPREPYALLNNRSSVALCGQIVSAISLLPRPYNVDWPIATLRLPASARDKLHQVSGFAGADVTSSLQAKYDISAYTLSPQRWITEIVEGELGWPAARFSQFFKVRLYVAPLPAGRQISVRVLPLYSFASLREEQLDSLWMAVLSHAADQREAFVRAFHSSTSQLRLLQYLIAARFGAAWVNRLQHVVQPEIAWTVEQEQANYIFTPNVTATVCQLAVSQPGLLETVPIFNSRSPRPPRSHTRKLGVDSDLTIQQQLTRPFTQLYQQKEAKARDLAKRYGSQALSQKNHRALMGRLKVGYSMEQLIDLFHRSWPDRLPDADAQAFVSLWLDMALDAGIAVPITAQDGNTVVRAFRHGEDVHFGEAEEHLCWEVLSAALRESERPHLPRVVTEKILVILLRYGVAKSFLQRWDDHRLGAPNTVGVRFALHGAVVRSDARELFGDEQGRALTLKLASAGRLIEAPGRKNVRPPWLVGEPRPIDHLPLAQGQIREARKLGLVLGKLLRADAFNGFTSTELLTLLATCGPVADVPAALAAEVKIVLLDLPDLLSRAADFERDPAGCWRSLREMNTAAATTSGAWKYRFGYGPHRAELIEALAQSIGDEITDELWRDIVETLTSADATLQDIEVSRLVNELGAWLTSAGLALRALQTAYQLAAFAQTSDQRIGADRGDRIEKLRSHCEDARDILNARAAKAFHKDLHATINQLYVDDSAPMLHAIAMRELKRLRLAAQALIDETQARSKGHGGLRKLTMYTGAIRIELGDSELPIDSSLAQQIHDIVDRHRRSGRAEVDIAVLPCHPTSTGWTIACAHREPRRYLARIAGALITECGGVAGMRIAIVGDLPRAECLYRGERSTDYFGEGFFDRIQVVSESLSRYRGHATLLASLHAHDETRAADTLELCRKAAGKSASKLSTRTEPSSLTSKTLPIRTWAAAYMIGTPVDHAEDRTESVDIGVITVIVKEARAVSALLERYQGFERILGGGRRSFVLGQLGDDDDALSVAATRCLRRTQTAATIAYDDLVERYNPKIVVLLGIAGSIHDDVELGDVVLATQVIEYDNRKETAGGIKRRGEASPIPSNMVRTIGDFFEAYDQPARLGEEEDAFNVHEGPIGTGSAVIGAELSDIRVWLNAFNDKTAAVETEAGGVTAPFYERAGTEDVRSFLIIRGISDRADRDKDDKWHDIASANAGACLEALAPFLRGLLRRT